MSTAPGDVVWAIPDKMGGSLAIVRALMDARPRDAAPGWLVLTDNVRDTETRAAIPAGAEHLVRVAFDLPGENLYAVLARLRRALPAGGGVLVSNDWIELAMEHAYPSGRAVVQLLHGDHAYYYDLAARHETVIDRFVAYSRVMFDGLRTRLPHRTAEIVHLPYGVPLPPRRRAPAPGPLRLVFAGRIEHGQKGVLDLPRIDAVLEARGVDVRWTIVGDGPDSGALREAWPAGRPVRFVGALDHPTTLAQLADFDVFVLPTRAEGFPVALVEAMGAGLVPVVNDVRSGVPEVVTQDETGCLVPVGDTAAAARAIAWLAADRNALERMSAAAAGGVRERFDPEARAREYYALFDDAARRHRPRLASRVPYGSRLDRPWLPNAMVRAVRRWRRR